MRKRVIDPKGSAPADAPAADWLNLDDVALVELTSEDPGHPIEKALVPGLVGGWRAAGPGEQTIRLVFDPPQRVRRIRLVFDETEGERAQEFVLRWSPDAGASYREIVRQQWTFGPDARREVEDYRAELDGVTRLELVVVPDRSGGPAHATLSELRLA